MKFIECPVCGAALDFGERCDCMDEKRAASAGTETTHAGDGKGAKEPCTSSISPLSREV